MPPATAGAAAAAAAVATASTDDAGGAAAAGVGAIAFLCSLYDQNDPDAPDISSWVNVNLEDAIVFYEISVDENRRCRLKKLAGKDSDKDDSTDEEPAADAAAKAEIQEVARARRERGGGESALAKADNEDAAVNVASASKTQQQETGSDGKAVEKDQHARVQRTLLPPCPSQIQAAASSLASPPPALVASPEMAATALSDAAATLTSLRTPA